MSVEHGPQPSESHERATAELEAMRQEQLEQLATSPEQTAEQSKERAQEAREIIHRSETDSQPVAAEAEAAPRPRTTFAAHLDRTVNYTQTLASIQRRLRPASRAFSRVIHTPIVERASEALERTVMRPSIVVGATWTAALVGLIFYVTARSYGYQLRGSEMLVALIGGALLGLAIEGVLRLLRRR